jgi:hypothetical protein
MNFAAMTDEQIQLGMQVAAMAQQYGVDPNFAVSVALSESSLRKKTPDAGAGAIGTMQILPSNAAYYGYTPEELADPETNINTGVRMLRQSLDRYGGDPVPAAIEYFAGPSAVKKYFESGEDPRVLGPKTQNYLNTLDAYHPLRNEDGGIPSYSQPIEQAEEPAVEAVEPPSVPPSDSDAGVAGGALGAAYGVGSKLAFKPTLPTERQVAAAQERLNVARDRLAQVGGSPQTVAQAQQELQAAQAAMAQARADAAAAQTSLRASGPRVEGASGVSNWMRAMAGEGQQIPETILAQAEDMTKANPKGGQALINQDAANLAKIRALGESQMQLAGTGRGQLMLPPQQAAALNQELAARQATQAAQSAQAAQQAEAARIAAGQRTSQASEALRQARAAASAQQNVDVAQNAAKRITPSTMARVGLAVANAPIIANTLGGVGTALSIQDAIERYKAGDTSEAVLSAIEAFFGGMSMLPPVNPAFLAAKGIGTIGGLGLMGSRAVYNNWDKIKEKANQPMSEMLGDIKSAMPDVSKYMTVTPAAR